MSEAEKNTQGQKPKILKLTIVSVVVIGFIIISTLLFLQHFAKVYSNPPEEKCRANISTLGKAIYMYAYDYDGRYPKSDKWCDLLVQNEYVAENLFKCPGNKKDLCGMQ